MTLLMAAPMTCLNKSLSLLSIQVFGISIMLLNAILITRIADMLLSAENPRGRLLTKALAFITTLLYYPLVYWSIMGMETGLLTALLLYSVLLSIEYTQTNKRIHLIQLAVSLGLAFLTRPDSALFTLPIFVFLLAHSLKTVSFSMVVRRALTGTTMYLAFIVGQTIFRHFYYGEFLPNTYVLKLTGMPINLRLEDGAAFIGPFLKETGFILATVVLGILTSFDWKKAFLLSIVAISVAYQVWNGGDPWDYWRIPSPTMPLLLLLFIQATYQLVAHAFNKVGFIAVQEGDRSNVDGIAQRGISIGVVAVGIVAVLWRFGPEMTLQTAPYSTKKNAMNLNNSILIDYLTDQDATVGVFWAGLIPYYTGRRAIDFLGKMDRHIAALQPDISGAVAWLGMKSVPGHNKYDLEYSIMKLQPTYIQGFAWGRQNIQAWALQNYKIVRYKDRTLFLRKHSEHVRWERIGARNAG